MVLCARLAYYIESNSYLVILYNNIYKQHAFGGLLILAIALIKTCDGYICN